jgi:beta-alanine--pyruvate transaminase
MSGPDHAIEFFHGYTYSAHPLACAAAIATLNVYRDEKLFERAKDLEHVWAEKFHSLRGLPNILDIRTIGLVGAVDLASKPDAVGARGFEAMERAFHDEGLMVRTAGDTIAVSPPLIASEADLDEIVQKLGNVLKKVA